MKRIEDYWASFDDSPTVVSLVGPGQPGPLKPMPSHPIVYVDGGTVCREAQEGFAIGDGDSYDGPLDLKLNPVKDFNDLSYPLKRLPATVKELNLWGFLGRRRDHELANFGEIYDCMHQHAPLRVSMDGDTVVGLTEGTWTLRLNGLFSVMALATTHLSLIGACAYQLPEMTRLAPLSSVGLSNIGHGAVEVTIEGAPIYVFTAKSIEAYET